MQKLALTFAACSGALSVIIGAFGAHGLQSFLEANNRIETFETAVKYQFYHTFLLLFIGIYIAQVQNTAYLNTAIYATIFGSIVFSGSLYALCATNIKILGAITPIGGVGFIIGWIALLVNILKNQF
jgi:uncharacterized membrane protein YgdD (TMEM256/DUF423 family)